MKFFFCVNTLQFLQASFNGGARVWLVSWPYLRDDVKQKIKDGKPKTELMLDSGAFSAWTKNVVIDLKDYITFIKNNAETVDYYFNLDVIPGKKGQKINTQEIERAAGASFVNYQIMRKAGLNPIPVFHHGEDEKWLHKMLEAGADYIGIGGIVGRSTVIRREWLDRVFTLLTDNSGRAIVKVHGLGMSSFELMRRYPWACMTDEHEVLTKEGWKKHKQLFVGESVLCFDNGVAFWDEIKEIPSYSLHNELLHQIDYRTFSARVTPNHRWRVWCDGKWQWRETHHLKIRDKIPRAPDHYRGPSKTIPDDLVELMAWFWTEGTIKHRKRKGYKQDSVTIYQSISANPSKVRRIRELLRRLKEKHCESISKGIAKRRHNTIRYKDVAFELYGDARTWLLATAPEKKLSWEFVSLLTEDQAKLFVEVSVLGDGWMDNRGRKTFGLSQAIPDNLDVFQAICLLACHASSRVNEEVKKCYVIRQSKVRWVSGRNSRIRHLIKPYSGKVWCIKVASGAFFTRCNEKIYVTGNSCDATSWAMQAAYGAVLVPRFRGNKPDYSCDPHEITISSKGRDVSDTNQNFGTMEKRVLSINHIQNLGRIEQKQVRDYLENVAGIDYEKATLDYMERARSIVFFMLKMQDTLSDVRFVHRKQGFIQQYSGVRAV